MSHLTLHIKINGYNFSNDLYRGFLGLPFDGVIGLLAFQVRDLDFDNSRDFETGENIVYEEIAGSGASCFLEMFRE